MNRNDFTPRAKTVLPIRPDAGLTVRLNRVKDQRCASDGPYRFIFEIVRTHLDKAGLQAVTCDFENGWLVAGFRHWGIFSLKLTIHFYLAGVATVIDVGEPDDRGWFRNARERKAEALIGHICGITFEAESLPGAAAYLESVRPPDHLDSL